MNINHQSVYRRGLESVSVQQNSIALDIGCGGGRAIRLLADKIPQGKVYGVDHSAEMVELSKKTNQSLVKNNRVEIRHGSVSDIPFQDNQFDLVTAFETIQFWPNLENDLKEVHRVLKPAGLFLVVNRFPDLQGRDAAWADRLQIHSAEQYRKLLNTVGLINILMDEQSIPGWILIQSTKV